MSSGSFISVFPGQFDAGAGHGDDAFAATGEAELFAGRCLDSDAARGNAAHSADRGLHRLDVRANPRRFADDGDIEVDRQTAVYYSKHAIRVTKTDRRTRAML